MASYAASASSPPSLPPKLHSSNFKLCRKSCLRRKRISFKVVQVIPARFNRAKPWRCMFRSWVQWCKSSVEEANHIPSWMKNWRTEWDLPTFFGHENYWYVCVTLFNHLGEPPTDSHALTKPYLKCQVRKIPISKNPLYTTMSSYELWAELCVWGKCRDQTGPQFVRRFGRMVIWSCLVPLIFS